MAETKRNFLFLSIIFLLLYQLQMKIMILYTLNVERTLEAHVQTDFISRLRFFLHKIDPFFSLMTAKQVRVSLVQFSITNYQMFDTFIFRNLQNFYYFAVLFSIFIYIPVFFGIISLVVWDDLYPLDDVHYQSTFVANNPKFYSGACIF